MNQDVLIVDDAHEIRVMFRALLSPVYTVREASDGQDALAAVTRQAPAVVLLDLSMPGMSGYETCRRMKRMPELQTTRIVVVSADPDAEHLQQALDAGADDFMIKPVERYELLSRVRLHMQLRSTIALAVDLQVLELSRNAIAQPSSQRATLRPARAREAGRLPY
jgi:CheY-like chemotaxis protein